MSNASVYTRLKAGCRQRIFGDATMMTKQAQSAAGLEIGMGSGSSSLMAKALAYFSSAYQSLKKENGIREAIWELEQLDDHALRDIGVRRHEIESYVRGRFK
jgi:uncharacterized protein YjiS (DUF1127 family)